MRYFIWAFVFSAFGVNAQGYGYVLFSNTGDTVLVRTSFGEIDKKDTITTTFVVYEKSEKRLKLLAVIKVHEKKTERHNVGFACADFNTVPSDTIKKYGLYHSANFFPSKEKGVFTIESKQLQKIDSVIGERKIFIRQIEHNYSLDGNKFHSEYVRQMSEEDQVEIINTKISEVYYCAELKKYYLVYWLDEDYFDSETSKIIHRHSRMAIIK